MNTITDRSMYSDTTAPMSASDHLAPKADKQTLGNDNLWSEVESIGSLQPMFLELLADFAWNG